MDLLGSTRAVTQPATTTESYDYDPWGVLLAGRTLTITNGAKEGFTSKERDAESQLDYFGARYYLSALGRWAAADPLAEKHPEWSAYAYALDGPVTTIDPDGRQIAAVAGHGAMVRSAATAGAAVVADYQRRYDAYQRQMVKGLWDVVTFNAVAEAVGGVASLAASGGRSAAVAEEAVAAQRATAAQVDLLGAGFADEALVVRGGGVANQTAERINAAIGPSRTPGIVGFSAQCNGGTCLAELGAPLRNKQLGVTTVGEIEAAGGKVVKTPGVGSHVTVTQLSGEKASKLMRVVKNPNPKQP